VHCAENAASSGESRKIVTRYPHVQLIQIERARTRRRIWLSQQRLAGQERDAVLIDTESGIAVGTNIGLD